MDEENWKTNVIYNIFYLAITDYFSETSTCVHVFVPGKIWKMGRSDSSPNYPSTCLILVWWFAGSLYTIQLKTNTGTCRLASYCIVYKQYYYYNRNVVHFYLGNKISKRNPPILLKEEGALSSGMAPTLKYFKIPTLLLAPHYLPNNAMFPCPVSSIFNLI